MKAVSVALKHIVSSLVICGGLGAAVAQPLVGHADGLTPRISATVVGRTTIQVTGYGFRPGDRVEVVDTTGNRVLNRVFTTATLPFIPAQQLPACRSVRPCPSPLPSLWGRIAVTMPPHVVHCVYQLVTVRALDLHGHRYSNTVSVVLGFGLCH